MKIKAPRGMPGSKPWLHAPRPKAERDKALAELLDKIEKWKDNHGRH